MVGQIGTETAVVVGTGPGLGWHLAKRFARAGMAVAVAARDRDKLEGLLSQEPEVTIRAYQCDAASAEEVHSLFQSIDRDLGEPDLVVSNAGAFEPARVLEATPEQFEQCWRVGCLSGFLVGQAAASRMVERGQGTLLFTGATASLRGGAGFANLAVPKFGLRALAQSLARELGPRGIHVGHVVIDGQIRSERYRHLAEEGGPDALLDPEAIAETFYRLHRQPRNAWTHELDLRPWVEPF